LDNTARYPDRSGEFSRRDWHHGRGSAHCMEWQCHTRNNLNANCSSQLPNCFPCRRRSRATAHPTEAFGYTFVVRANTVLWELLIHHPLVTGAITISF